MPLLLFLISLLFVPMPSLASETENSTNITQYLQKANNLFEIKDYENSLNLFTECYQVTHDTECIRSPLLLIKKEIDSLPQITKKELTVFTPDKRLNPTSVFQFMVTGPVIPLIVDRYEEVPGSPINIKTPADTKNSTETIPFFQQWIKRIQNLALDCYINDNQELCLIYTDSINKFKNKLNGYFRIYLSYEVSSPILARVQQLIFDANASKIFGVDENKIREAAKLLAMLNEDVIRNVNQDVRNQFLDVLKQFKENAGEELYKELQVIQSFQDKILNNKYGEQLF